MEFELVYIVVGLMLGTGIGWLVAKNRIETELVQVKAHAAAREVAFEEKSELLAAQMENVATRVSQQNSETFLQLAEERLGKVSTSAEKDHEARKKEMEDLIKPMTESLSNLDMTLWLCHSGASC